MEWRAIPESYYLVSECGDIYSKFSDTILKPQINKGGYLQLTLYISNIRANHRVHRVVGRVFLGENEELQINHKDGNKLNNHFTNLEYVTSKENHEHAIDNGLMPIGSKKPGAKLDEETVKKIKNLMLNGLSDGEISDIIGTVTSTVSKIRQGERWTHVLPNLIIPKTSTGRKNNSRGKKKLEVEDVLEIRAFYRGGKSLAEIGRMFSVHSGTIDSIVKYKTWKDCP
jgi:hypothetical protein